MPVDHQNDVTALGLCQVDDCLPDAMPRVLGPVYDVGRAMALSREGLEVKRWHLTDFIQAWSALAPD